MPSISRQQSWEDFSYWCFDRGLTPAPAHPWTVAAYIRAVGGGMRLDDLRRHLGHIGSAHYEKQRTRPDRHPIVKRTLESLRREREEAKKPKAPALFQPDDFVPDDTEAPKPKRRPAAKKVPTTKRGLRSTPKLVRRKRV